MDGRLTALLLIVGLVPIAGCLGTGSLFGEACPAPELLVYHGDPGSVPTAEADVRSPVLIWSTHEKNGTALLNTGLSPAGHWHTTMDPREDPEDQGKGNLNGPIVDHLPGGKTSFGGFWITPPTPEEGQDQPDVAISSMLASSTAELPPGQAALACEEPTTVEQPLPFTFIDPSDEVRPGVGVLVHTVGLWTNGTSFYTNDAAYHEGAYPKGYDVEDWGGSDPLPVYVYDQDPDEIPRRYQEAGYVTTIRGFNEALKGMTVGQDALTFFPGEQGYTTEGNEDHDLYGDDLIFYIEALEVHEEPCPVPEPVCDVPNTPEPVPPPVRSIS